MYSAQVYSEGQVVKCLFCTFSATNNGSSRSRG